MTRLRPTTLAELRDAMRAGHERILIAGAGTAAGWGGTPDPPDAVLDMTGLAGVIAYHPADMTVAVRAGTPLSTVQDALAAEGQRIALDAARIPLGATVGGLVATADGGPARHAYGTLRDSVIGVTVVLADGTVARSGGQVIKNVAGYDLGKLFHGSLGTLGAVAEVILRVYPRPAATRTVALACDAEAAFDLAGRITRDALEPAALEWYAGRLLIRFEGTPEGVARRAAQFEEVDEAVWNDVAAVAVGESGDTIFRAGTLPSLSPWVAARLAELTTDFQLTSSLGVGVHTVRLRNDDGTVLTVLRDEIAARGGSTTVLRRAGDVPAWGEPPPAVAVMRAVKRQFDPDNRLGAGRFAPWF